MVTIIKSFGGDEMSINRLKVIRKKIAIVERIPFIGKILKKYYRKQLFKEIDRIVLSKRKEETNEFFKNFVNNFDEQ